MYLKEILYGCFVNLSIIACKGHCITHSFLKQVKRFWMINFISNQPTNLLKIICRCMIYAKVIFKIISLICFCGQKLTIIVSVLYHVCISLKKTLPAGACKKVSSDLDGLDGGVCQVLWFPPQLASHDLDAI